MASPRTVGGLASGLRSARLVVLGPGLDPEAQWIDRTHIEVHPVPWIEAIALIQGAGGVAGLAHPPFDLREGTLAEYRDAGLGSIEVAGPGIDRKCGTRWRGWALAMGLAPIAGTDFHAPDRPGRWIGFVATSAEDLERLRRLRNDETRHPIPI